MKNRQMKKIALPVACLLACMVLPARADQALATSKNCLACHQVDKKVIGPAFTDVAARYGGEPDAVDKLARKIAMGSVGAWGAVPMPPNVGVSELEARTLAVWVLSRK
jgi:cytochrome c